MRKLSNFTMENIYAVLFTFVLLLPLILQLQMLIVDPKKLCTIFHYYATNNPEELTKPSTSILQHYPKEASTFNASSSESKMSLINLRFVSSSPVMSSGTSNSNADTSKKMENNRKQIIKTLADAKHSFTFAKTDQVLPIVDITWNYRSYRYKIFESCLQNYYGDKYPPGEVVLNSMQLNLLDSRTNVSQAIKDLFDFAKEHSEPRLDNVSRKLEIEYLNPLDHFVAKQTSYPPTVERFTETEEKDRGNDTRMSGRPEDPIGVVITTGQENHPPNRRSFRKIEAPCKHYLSSSKRVHRTNDSRSGKNLLTGESTRL